MEEFKKPQQKEYTPEFDFNGAELAQKIDKINSKHFYFKLNAQELSFDGNFCTFKNNGTKMTLDELEEYADREDLQLKNTDKDSPSQEYYGRFNQFNKTVKPTRTQAEKNLAKEKAISRARAKATGKGTGYEYYDPLDPSL